MCVLIFFTSMEVSLSWVQEDLTSDTTKKVIDGFKRGKKPKPGPQAGRHTSENSAGLTCLTDKVRSSPFY